MLQPNDASLKVTDVLRRMPVIPPNSQAPDPVSNIQPVPSCSSKHHLQTSPEASGFHPPGDHSSFLHAEEPIWGNLPHTGGTTNTLPMAGQRLIPTKEELQMHGAAPQVPLFPQAPVLQPPLLNWRPALNCLCLTGPTLQTEYI